MKPLLYLSDVGYSYEHLSNDMLDHPFIKKLMNSFGINGFTVWGILIGKFTDTGNKIPYDEKNKEYLLNHRLSSLDNVDNIINFCIVEGIFYISDGFLSVSEIYVSKKCL